MTIFRRISVMAVAMLCLNSCVVGAEPATDTDKYDSQLLQPGAMATDFTIADPARPEPIKLSSLRGHYVVLEFWASWCPDCRKTTPDVVALYKEYAPLGVEFVGVSFDTDSAAWRRYVEANGMEWLQYSELKKWKAGTKLDSPYRVNWIPTFYLVDPEGRIAAGSIATDKIKAALEALKPTLTAATGGNAAEAGK